MRVLFVLAFLTGAFTGVFGQSSSPSSGQVVPGWHRTGNNINGVYKIAADTTTAHGGKSSVTLECQTCNTEKTSSNKTEYEVPFGSIVQTIKADDYRNKRVRFSAFLKTSNVSGDGAGLWFRVDGAEYSPVAFDNMSEPDRLIRGTTDWKRYSIVLDVPSSATSLNYGVLLSGRGQIWIDDASVDVVDKKVPTTGDPHMVQEGQAQLQKMTPDQRADFERNKQKDREFVSKAPTHPQNLGFEQ